MYRTLNLEPKILTPVYAITTGHRAISRQLLVRLLTVILLVIKFIKETKLMPEYQM